MKIQKVKSAVAVFTALILFSFAVFAIAQENSTTNKNIFQDSDQDGLTDAEEKVYGTNPQKSDTDGDGYSDGVEIKSGYNPLKPSPGDKIVASSATDTPNQKAQVAGTSTKKDSQKNEENLTDKVSSKITTLLTKGDMSDIKIEDINSIIEEATGDKFALDDLPEIDEKTIQIKKQNYSKLSADDRKAREKEDALEYLTSIFYIMGTNSPQKISSLDDVNNLSSQITDAIKNFSFESADLSFFDNLLDKGNNILKQLQEIEVPETMLDIHKRGLQLAAYSSLLRSEVEIDPKDPVKSMTYLSKASGMISLSNSFFQEANNKIAELGITGLSFEYFINK